MNVGTYHRALALTMRLARTTATKDQHQVVLRWLCFPAKPSPPEVVYLSCRNCNTVFDLNFGCGKHAHAAQRLENMKHFLVPTMRGSPSFSEC
jgi:hypothetical protein